MSTKYIAEKLTRKMLSDIFTLLQGAHNYTSKEIIAILKNDHAPELITKSLYRLQRQNYLSGSASKGYTLTEKGERRFAKLEFSLLEQTQAWDRTWRLVTYDIPEEDRRARDAIRRLIKRLGFVQLQKSIWAHPLPCLDEFRQIRDTYGIHSHVLLIETLHTDEYDYLLRKFQAVYPNLE